MGEPESAATVCLRARTRRRAVENPWMAAAQTSNLLMLGCLMVGQSALNTLPFAPGIAALCLVLALFVQLHRLWILRRTAIAVELNLPLAEKGREETPD